MRSIRSLFRKKARKPTAPISVIVHGFLEWFDPAKDRPGCVLHVTSGGTLGHYYVPLSPHDCRDAFPERTTVAFRLDLGTEPDSKGVYDTSGNANRRWEAA